MTQTTHNSQKKIHLTTKKIKKTTRQSSPQTPKKEKKYDTHNKEKRWAVIQGVMKALGLNITKETFCPVNLLRRLESTSLLDLNPILTKVLTKNVDLFVDSSEDLKKWRRKIKEWVQNFNKYETRGGVLVTDDMLPEFKARLIPVLQSLPSRSFDLLREQVLLIVQDMHKDNSKKGVAFNKKTACSKHFWYEFLERNPDIKEIYERLPIVKKKRAEASRQVKSCLSETDIREEDYETATPNSSDSNAFQEENKEIFCSPVTFGSEAGEFDISSPLVEDYMEEEKLEEIPMTPVFNVFSEEFQATPVPKYDFYKSYKRIVETEDNEYQREYFKSLFYN